MGQRTGILRSFGSTNSCEIGCSNLIDKRYHKGVLGRKDVLQGGKYAKSSSNKSKNDKSKSGKVSF
jgi:hypothetical protein